MSHVSNRSLVVFGDSLSDNGNLFDLIGRPQPPYWSGHFSNGPTYAEQLAQMLGMRLDDRAFGFGEASDASVPLLINPATGQPLPINLSDQVAGYIAGLHGHRPPPQTTVVINMGSNDYQSYLFSDLPKDLPTVQQHVANVIGGIAQAIDDLTAAGVSKIVLFTLPDLAITPIAQSLGPDAVAFAHLLDVANNDALMHLAASHPGIQVVDLLQLSDALAADPQAFGFNPDLSLMWVDLIAAGSTQFAPNEIGFFDIEHPTSAAHGVIAAFSDATLTADHVLFLDGTQSVVHAQRGDNFIFAKALDPADSHLSGDYTIYGNSGDDVIVAGSGDVTVNGGAGDDVISAGAGNAQLYGGRGDDLLATNSNGTNTLDGGEGDDVLVANRAGTDTLRGDEGDDLFVLKQSSTLINANGGVDFGTQKIAGGDGHDTLRFVIDDQDPAAKAAFVAKFLKIEAAFDFAAVHHHAGSFQVDGLDVSGIERLELQIDSVSRDPQTPYLITHDIVAADGHAGHQDPTIAANLHTADSWGWMTV